jgi:hypothetical protein
MALSNKIPVVQQSGKTFFLQVNNSGRIIDVKALGRRPLKQPPFV